MCAAGVLLSACDTVTSIYGSEDLSGANTVYADAPPPSPPVLFTDPEAGYAPMAPQERATLDEIIPPPLDGALMMPPGVADTPNINLQNIANARAGGSVEVYSIDEPLPPGVTPGRPLPGGVSGVAYSQDESVTVYPFDDNLASYYTSPGQPPGLMPPSESKAGFLSPFDDQGRLLPPAVMEGRKVASIATMVDKLQPGEPVRIYFEHDSSVLGSSGIEALDALVEELKLSGGDVVVQGHASRRAEKSDPVDRKIVNLRKSMDRALHVTSTLIEKGVPAESITTVAYGEVRPAEDGQGENAESKNRRVEVYTDQPQ